MQFLILNRIRLEKKVTINHQRNGWRIEWIKFRSPHRVGSRLIKGHKGIAVFEQSAISGRFFKIEREYCPGGHNSNPWSTKKVIVRPVYPLTFCQGIISRLGPSGVYHQGNPVTLSIICLCFALGIKLSFCFHPLSSQLLTFFLPWKHNKRKLFSVVLEN